MTLQKPMLNFRLPLLCVQNWKWMIESMHMCVLYPTHYTKIRKTIENTTSTNDIVNMNKHLYFKTNNFYLPCYLKFFISI